MSQGGLGRELISILILRPTFGHSFGLALADGAAFFLLKHLYEDESVLGIAKVRALGTSNKSYAHC